MFLGLVARGHSILGAAGVMGMRPRTGYGLSHRIRRAYGVDTLTGAVVLAVYDGEIELPPADEVV